MDELSEWVDAAEKTADGKVRWGDLRVIAAAHDALAARVAALEERYDATADGQPRHWHDSIWKEIEGQRERLAALEDCWSGCIHGAAEEVDEEPRYGNRPVGPCERDAYAYNEAKLKAKLNEVTAELEENRRICIECDINSAAVEDCAAMMGEVNAVKADLERVTKERDAWSEKAESFWNSWVMFDKLLVAAEKERDTFKEQLADTSRAVNRERAELAAAQAKLAAVTKERDEARQDCINAERESRALHEKLERVRNGCALVLAPACRDACDKTLGKTYVEGFMACAQGIVDILAGEAPADA